MMGSSIRLVLICILLSFINQINGQSAELIAGHVIYRHGDRTPVTTFPTDPVPKSDWPNGYGQLTSRGIEQHHHLGKVIRNRYETLLSPNYTASEIHVRSTDIDRTLMSAQSNLVGLYPVLNWTDDSVPIQPIPIHTVALNLDFLLGQNDCPRYDQIEDEVDQSDDVKKANAYYQPFFNQLEEWTNLTNMTVYNAWDVADTIYVESLSNKAPSWANAGVQTNLSDINDLAFHYLFSNNDSQRIRGGPSIQDIWFNMNNSVYGESFWKVKMYSAHDTTVSAVLSFLGINYPHQPKYASAIFVDLYRTNSTYFVRVEYLNVTGANESYRYLLNGCPDMDCPLDIFTSIYQPRFPASAVVECLKKGPPLPPSSGDDNGKLLLVLIIVIVCLIVSIFLIFLCLFLRKTDRDPHLLGVNQSSSPFG